MTKTTNTMWHLQILNLRQVTMHTSCLCFILNASHFLCENKFEEMTTKRIGTAKKLEIFSSKQTLLKISKTVPRFRRDLFYRWSVCLVWKNCTRWLGQKRSFYKFLFIAISKWLIFFFNYLEVREQNNVMMMSFEKILRKKTKK